MMIDNMEQRRREFQALQRAAAEHDGRRRAALQRLQEEFGVETVEAAEALLPKLAKKKKATAEEDYQEKKAYEALLEEHKDEVAQFLKEVEE